MTILTCFLFILIPYAASLNFSFPTITPENYKEIVTTGGGAYISDAGIQVTPEVNRNLESRRAGRATYFKLLHLWDKTSTELASFSTSFSFVIDSKNQSNYGDGLTFFIAQNNSMVESNLGKDYGGEAMGLPVNVTTNVAIDPFVAVEFDTYRNKGLDPDFLNDHVGINVKNLSSVVYQFWRSNITYGKECHAWIDYDSDSKNLSVSYTGFLNDIEVRQDTLYYTIDLRDVLPEQVIFGFSAATGASFQSNNVKSWSFNSSVLHIDEPNSVPPTRSPQNIHQSNIPSPATSPLPATSRNSEKGKKGTAYMVIVLAGPSVLVCLLVIFAIVCWKKRQNKGHEMEELESGVEMNNEFEMGTGPRRFSYQELATSTGGFAEKEKLGEGGFGKVYKGFLEDAKIYVAVKRVTKNAQQGVKEYASEVKIISRLRHRNLVQLIGWCHENGELLLAYEHMEKGSLDSHLFTGNSLLSWGTRYKIARGLASALLYLQEEWEQCVLHRDIKSSNVMLDTNFNAKLGDFGFAKLVDHEIGSHKTKLAGTLGYMAPEYVLTGRASRESDVFSFGVVALEIACGRKPMVVTAQENQILLVEWVWASYGTGTLLETVDPRLGLDYEEEEMKRLMIVGLWCVHPDPDLRASMRQVIQVLNSEASLPLLPSKMPVASYLSSPNRQVC